MLEPPKPRRLWVPITDSLGDLVPADYFSRHLEEQLGSGLGAAGWAPQ
jgi:hypothetical protein